MKQSVIYANIFLQTLKYINYAGIGSKLFPPSGSNHKKRNKNCGEKNGIEKKSYVLFGCTFAYCLNFFFFKW